MSERGLGNIVADIRDRIPMIRGVEIENIYPDGGCMGMWLKNPVPQASEQEQFVNAAHCFTETMRRLCASLSVIAQNWMSIHKPEASCEDISRAILALDSSIDRCEIAWASVKRAIDTGRDTEESIAQFMVRYTETRESYQAILRMMGPEK